MFACLKNNKPFLTYWNDHIQFIQDLLAPQEIRTELIKKKKSNFKR